MDGVLSVTAAQKEAVWFVLVSVTGRACVYDRLEGFVSVCVPADGESGRAGMYSRGGDIQTVSLVCV